MKELSLHILDIAKNSVKAGADTIEIGISELPAENLLRIVIKDDGCGMSPALLATVIDPFTTTRTTRKVGLGLPLFKLAAELTGGTLSVESKIGIGTTVTAEFVRNHIDRMPVGDIAGTMAALIQGSPDINFTYHYAINNKEFSFSTEEMKKELDGVPVDSLEVLAWIRDFINENTRELNQS